MTAFDARAGRASIRQKYHLRHVGGDTHIWNVRRLVELAGDPAPDMMLPDDIAELDGNWWFSPDGPAATPRRIAAHMRLAMEADLSHPIILCADGRLMARAVAEQRSEIAYVRFAKTPAPDYVNVSLDALPYPEDEP